MCANEIGPLTADTLFVYPTALKAEEELRRQAGAAGCLLGHRATTFPQLTDTLARDLGGTPRVLRPELAAVVLADALDKPGVPEAFGRRQRGLVRELLGVIGELKAAYLGPAETAEIASTLPPGAAAARMSDLARVYAAYEAGLARLGAVDRHGRDRQVCEGLAAAEAAGTLPRALVGVRRVVFAEIYDFSVLQFLIATSLIRLVGDAELIVFTHPENVDATRFLDRTWNRFVADPGIANQVLPSFVEGGGREGTLAAALEGAFAPERPAPAADDGHIRLVAAPSRYREVEAAVRDIRRRLEDAGHRERPERIALLARDLTVYGSLIEDVCRRYRVPVHFRRGKPLLASGLVKACVNVVRCVADGFPRGRLEAVLDSDYLRAAAPGLAAALRRTGYVDARARPLADYLAPGDQAGAGARLLAVTEMLRPLDGTRTVREHVAMLRRTLRRLGLRPVGSHALPVEVVRRDAHAAEAFDEALSALGGITGALGVGRVPLGEFVRLLLAILEPQEVEDHAERAGSVRALSVVDARGLDFDTVYLLGLDDGTFPAPRSENPLLPDAVKRAVNQVAGAVLARSLGARAAGLPRGALLRTAREASLEDPFLFFLALSMARRDLVLSWPTVDERGNPTVRSPFVDEVVACVEGGLHEEKLSATALVPEARECCEAAELLARAALDRWARARTAPPDRLAAALRGALPDGGQRLAAIDRRARIEERRSWYFLTPASDRARKDSLADAHVGRLQADLGPLAERLTASRWSPSQLERLGACRFRFFAERVLGLGEQLEPELDVEPREQGKLVHAVLADFFTQHPLLPRDLAEARALGQRFLAEARATAAGAIGPKDPRFLALAWTRLETALDELIGLEHPAQRDQEAAGLTVERRLEKEVDFVLADPAGGPALRLHGWPDRVEVHRRGAEAVRVRVLDYKVTRNLDGYGARLDPTKDLGRTSFQIPVYLLGTLAPGVAGMTGDTVLEGGFLALLAPEGKKVQMRAVAADLLDPGPATAAGTPTLAQRARDLVAAARGGRFEVDPAPCDPFCPYRGVCRYQPPPLEDEEVDG